ncbi:sensor histidine kinase [Geminicoccaceae bacterium 1502E]|nr:sensor histidine kinase [Geminicoccaceae bacterium 1502E]
MTGRGGAAQPRRTGRGGAGLKARMALVLGLVLLVPAAYATLQTVLAYRAQTARQLDTLERTAQLISAYQGEFLQQTWTLLEGIAVSRDALAPPDSACRGLPATELQNDSIHGGFALLDRDGRVRCRVGDPLPGKIAGQPWFEELRRTRRQVIGRGESAAGGGTLVLAVPLLEGGTFSGAVAASVLLARFTAVPSSLPLPEKAVALVVDRAGMPLRPEAAERTSPPGSEVIRGLLQGSAPIHHVEGGDGRRWAYAAAPIGTGLLSVVVGLPVERWSWLQPDLVLGVLVPTLMLALAVIAIWIATDYLVNRHIVSLAQAARALSRGELGTVAVPRGAPREIEELAWTLAFMTRRVHEREAALEASLAQKDLLLKEIHHRIKNNLQIVTSLLNLRAQKLPSPAAREALHEAQARIKALALVHRHLYEQPELGRVAAEPFVGEICALLEDLAAPSGEEIAVVVDSAPVMVTTDQAVPLALLLTEALSNALRHAYPEGCGGRVEVSLKLDGSRARLRVADHGIGLPGEETAGGLGLTLIHMLARQIGGRVTLDSDAGGTRLILDFPAAPAA